jgi:hypothetical protein
VDRVRRSLDVVLIESEEAWRSPPSEVIALRDDFLRAETVLIVIVLVDCVRTLSLKL